MLPWSWLSELERRAVVEHVKSFARRFGEEEPGVPTAIPPQPPLSPELLARGAAAYREAGCPSCHGARGAGDGGSASTLRRDSGAPIRPRPFAERRFLRGGSMPDLWLTFVTGLDGTPMPSYETLAPEDLWAIAAHVRSLAGLDEGREPALPPDPEEQLGVQIDLPGR
jgi:cytochrome c oxidase cbb3-type subunit 2